MALSLRKKERKKIAASLNNSIEKLGTNLHKED